jgi:glycosyltransferase involved in cell wall biosynthesis
MPSRLDAARGNRLNEDREKTMRLSIVIPSRNTPADLLRRALLSAVAAVDGAVEYEIVVVDDCSDRPVDVEALTETATAPGRIRSIRARTRLGIAGARNLGAATATGSFLTFLDSDDVLKRGSLTTLLQAASPSRVVFADHEVYEAPHPGFVRRKHRWVPLLGDCRGRMDDPFFYCNFIVLPVVIPRLLFESVGGYTDGGYAGEHVGLYAALAARANVEFVHVPEALYEYWPRPSGYSNSDWVSHHRDKGEALSRALALAGFGSARYSGVYLSCHAEPTLYLPVVADVLRIPRWADVDLEARSWRPAT